jgi:hypothetical protein
MAKISGGHSGMRRTKALLHFLSWLDEPIDFSKHLEDLEVEKGKKPAGGWKVQKAKREQQKKKAAKWAAVDPNKPDLSWAAPRTDLPPSGEEKMIRQIKQEIKKKKGVNKVEQGRSNQHPLRNFRDKYQNLLNAATTSDQNINMLGTISPIKSKALRTSKKTRLTKGSGPALNHVQKLLSDTKVQFLVK